MSPRTTPKTNIPTPTENPVSNFSRKKTILRNRKCRKHFKKSKKVMLSISQDFPQPKINML